MAGVFAAMFAGSASAVVFNGDFEDVSSSNPGLGLVNKRPIDTLASGPGKSWDVYTSIPGWTTAAGAGIEVQTNRTLNSIDAHSGQHYIELDSHPSPNSNSTMQQDVFLSAGRYRLDFWYSPRTGDINTNGIAFSVTGAAPTNNALLSGGVTGPSASNGTSVGAWTMFSAMFAVADVDSPIRLAFSATGSANTLGGFIDDVSISAIPIPAALPLLLTALGGLGFVARRRRQTS
ncbi:MAG: VPLPA-CTERM sorting domain-containing protein [Pseudomonadota bacterium]